MLDVGADEKEKGGFDVRISTKKDKPHIEGDTLKLHADALLKNMYSIGTTDEEVDPDGDKFYLYEELDERFLGT